MAFAALYKWFSQFRKSYFEDWIYWYKEFVLKTPEQREAERCEKKRRVYTTMAEMAIISALLKENNDWSDV